MKKLIVIMLAVCGFYSVVHADSKLTVLSTDTTPSLTDVIYEVKNPAGAAASKQVAIRDLMNAATSFITISSGPITYANINNTISNSSVSATYVNKNNQSSGSDHWPNGISTMTMTIPSPFGLKTSTVNASTVTISGGLYVAPGMFLNSNSVTGLEIDPSIQEAAIGSGAFGFLSDGLKTQFYTTSGVELNMSDTVTQFLINPVEFHDASLKLTAFNCSGNLNSGKLTVDGAGVVSCADDISSSGGSSSLAISSNGVVYSSPTPQINIQYPLRGTLVGTTAQIILDKISLSTGVSGALPTNSLSGQISLSTQVVGLLPVTSLNSLISLSTGVIGLLPTNNLSGQIDLSTQVVGLLPVTSLNSLISLSTGVTGSLPTNSLSGKISLSTQVVGVLPVTSLNSLISLSTGVTGNLPVTSLDSLISLSTGVTGLLPVASLQTKISLSTGVFGSLPAASIAAGSLGASVLVSSITQVVQRGTFGSATISPTITFNDQGQIVAASSNTIATGSGGGSSLAVTTGSATQFTGAPVSSPTAVIVLSSASFTSRLTGSATNFVEMLQVSLSTGVFGSLPAASVAAGSLGASVLVSSITQVVQRGTFGSATISPTITFNDQGQIVAASSNTIATGSGGASTLAVSTGNVLSFNGAVVSSPTAIIIFSSDSFRAKLTASNTAYISAAYDWHIRPETARSTSTSVACVMSNPTTAFTSYLLCDASVNEDAAYVDTLYPYSGGALNAEIQFTMASATSGNVVDGIQVYCSTSTANIDVDAVTWPAPNLATIAVRSTAGYPTLSQFALATTGGSCVQSAIIMVRFTRQGGNTGDSATGDQEVRTLRIYEN